MSNINAEKAVKDEMMEEEESKNGQAVQQKMWTMMANPLSLCSSHRLLELVKCYLK